MSEKRKRFIFTVTLAGEGETVNNAWANACEGHDFVDSGWDRVTEEPLEDDSQDSLEDDSQDS